MADGLVACRQLGYPSVSAVFKEDSFSHGNTLPIFMDDLACVGDETLLSNCQFLGFGNHNCIVQEAAGLK